MDDYIILFTDCDGAEKEVWAITEEEVSIVLHGDSELWTEAEIFAYVNGWAVQLMDAWTSDILKEFC